MDPEWLIFERNAINFLNRSVTIQNVTFEGRGGSDSTDTDIFVKYKEKILFTIEAKKSPSQSGQIVVLLQNGKYNYSKESKFPKDQFVDGIISYLNSNINKYSNPGSKGLQINIGEKLLSNWIKGHYKRRNVRFVITSQVYDEFEKSFIRIFPIEELESNFIIKAVLRKKRSGTSVMPRKYYLEVKELMKKQYGDGFSLKENGELIYSDKNIKGSYLGDKFYITTKNNNYLVKKRSVTNNPNVIFSLKYKGEHKTDGFDKLRETILKSIQAF